MNCTFGGHVFCQTREFQSSRLAAQLPFLSKDPSVQSACFSYKTGNDQLTVRDHGRQSDARHSLCCPLRYVLLLCIMTQIQFSDSNTGFTWFLKSLNCFSFLGEIEWLFLKAFSSTASVETAVGVFAEIVAEVVVADRVAVAAVVGNIHALESDVPLQLVAALSPDAGA
ncbi:hypothetical protein HHK36_004366 [Tetracentron sinense]|uniref:Uncharacterized protein n=1 Tax=Tetracentron sinense TaxID=13715 RepID=A0A834ZST8_TETSI|nr:hypothetical protein HHK36_004366 [Tetracentron sinense]